MQVIVSHDFLPYEIAAHYVNGNFCSILLINNFFRVVHTKTGFGFQTFRVAQDAKALILRVNRDSGCNAMVDKLTWEDYKEKTELLTSVLSLMSSKTYNLDLATEEEATAGYAKEVKYL